jgi:tRNA C32,U32 (ribose-2'-O)-methylase TrmJ
MTDAIARATHAEQIISDPLVVDTLAAIERKWIEAVMASPVADAEGRELAYRMFKAVQQFRDEFKAIVSDGQYAAAMQRKTP